jgi:predicted RNA binding protein YcfA (HicA-like mRNA interferase family)
VVPRKKRDIRRDLRKLGFVEDKNRGKGDHTIFVHANYPGHISVDGADGDDAKPYDERNVRNAKQVLGAP